MCLNRKLICSLAFLLAFLCSPAVFATTEQVFVSATHGLLKPRNLLFSRLTPENGLSQAAVSQIVQDRHGFIWIGTQEGLNRYDGKSFKIYEHDAEDPSSISNDWIKTLLVDQRGDLWVGTENGGLNRYRHDIDNFQSFRHNPNDNYSLSSDRIRVVYQDKQGIFWIGTDGGGLDRFDPDQGVFEHFRHDSANAQSLPSNVILSIFEDRAGNLWIGTNGGGLVMMDRETNQFTTYQHDPKQADSISGNKISVIYEDRDGRLWVGSYGAGLNLFDATTKTFKHFKFDANNPNSLSHNRVHSILQDRDGTLWIGTDHGLNEWREQHQSFVRYRHNPTDLASLSDNRVVSIFQDHGGVLWVGTYYGVNKWNYVSDTFSYFQQFGSHIKLSSNIVTSIAESADNILWVGTYGAGLNQISTKNGTVKYYIHNKSNQNSLNDNRVMALSIDQKKSVWIGTRNSGLNKLEPTTGKFSHFLHDPNNTNSLSSNSITTLLAEANGLLWIGTHGGGLNRLDTSNNQFTVFRHNPDDTTSISSDRVMAIYRDRNGMLWIGTEDGGINRFDESQQAFIRYQHNPDDPESLSSNVAWAILEGTDGSLWVGTGGGGLNRWLPENRKQGIASFKKYHKTDGLISDSIQSILEDNVGQLWLSSNRGLIRLDPDSGETRNFSRNNGLKNNDFNFAARLKDRTGKMFFGSTAGVVSFRPEHIRTNRHKPEVVLTAQTRNGPFSTTYSAVPLDQILELDYLNDLVTFEFTGMDFAAPEKNRYQYKLDGFDKEWTQPAKFTRTTYTSLPPGKYTFRVKASNNDGIWNEYGVAMKLQVLPPPWLSPWAYVIYTLIIGGAILAYLRIQARKLERETEQRIQLEVQVEERTKEIRESKEQLEQLNKKLEESSFTDSLTGLKNRRFLHNIIDSEVEQVNRRVEDIKQSGNTESIALDIYPALSIMMIDLDGFKAINDTYGHHAGDLALIQVRDILQSCCRKSDTIIRWGGDEFLIMGRNTTARAAEKLAERIRIGLAEHQYQLDNGHVGKLSGSIGFALYPFLPHKPKAISWEQVAGIADRAAYVSKQNGRNAWVGIYGNKNTPEDVSEQIKHHLDVVYNNGQVNIKTSIEGELVFEDNKKAQAGQR